MPKDINKLTDKQRAFAEAYTDNTGTVTIDGEEKQTFNHATRSAIKAGYKDGHRIRVMASQVLNTPKIQEYMDKLRIQYKTKQVVSLDWLKEQYMDRYEAWKADDKTNAKGCLDSLTRMHGGFTDNINNKDTTDRMKQLSDTERAEARRLADVLLSKEGVG